MTCEKFLQLLENGTMAETVDNPEWENHGSACPICKSTMPSQPEVDMLASTLKAQFEGRLPTVRSKSIN